MADDNKKLFLLDAYALIYRAYYAFIKNPRVNSKGFNTSAIFGFTNTLWDVLKNQDPTHIAVVFDTAEETARTTDYTEYKANREEMPEDIAKSIPFIQEMVKAFNIPVLFSDGYEADDVIGTLAKKAVKKGFKVYMMTPDKDFAQLVEDDILLYRPGRMGKPAEKWGIEEVKKKFGIERIDQVVEIQGLMGDSVDNIPGVPGVGPKTAQKLIAKYGDIETLLQNTDELKGKLKERIEENKEQAILSKKLATILLDAPVEFDENDLKKEDLNEDRVKELFAELEFRGLSKRILGEEISSASSGQMDLFSGDDKGETSPESELNTIENTEHQYHFVDSPKKRKDLIQQLGKQKSICFDTETNKLQASEAELVGLSFSFKEHQAYYVPVPAEYDDAKNIVDEFKPIFENQSIEKVAQNLKYDMSVLKKYEVDISGPLFDTMLAHYLLQPDMRHNMKTLAETYLTYRPVEIETLIGKKGKAQKSMRDVPQNEISDYAAEDADVTLRLKNVFEKKMKEDYLKKLFYDIEVPLIHVLSDMEHEGVKLDIEALKEISGELGKEIDKLSKAIMEMADAEFNLDSPKQLGVVLFEKMKIIEKPKKTKSGQYSTSENTLSKLENKHEIIPKVLEYRQLKKLKNTYVDPLPSLVNKNTGRLHTNYMQTVAATGRLSSTNPNLQNIPIRTEKGKAIRKAFISRDENYSLLAADYSQIELRIIAALAKDKDMMDAFKKGTDIHATTAAKVFDVSLEDVDRDMRSKAKMVNFGIIYGISAFGLSQRLGISRSEAKTIIDNYFEKFSSVKEYMDGNIEFARENGYVETIMNRRRYLKDINSRNATVRGHAERNAINAPIQGSAADIIKMAMINIHKKFHQNNFKSKMLLQVHDELVFDVHKDEREEVKSLVLEEMQHTVELEVPLLVEANYGKNWLEAH